MPSEGTADLKNISTSTITSGKATPTLLTLVIMWFGSKAVVAVTEGKMSARNETTNVIALLFVFL